MGTVAASSRLLGPLSPLPLPLQNRPRLHAAHRGVLRGRQQLLQHPGKLLFCSVQFVFDLCKFQQFAVPGDPLAGSAALSFVSHACIYGARTAAGSAHHSQPELRQPCTLGSKPVLGLRNPGPACTHKTTRSASVFFVSPPPAPHAACPETNCKRGGRGGNPHTHTPLTPTPLTPPSHPHIPTPTPPAPTAVGRGEAHHSGGGGPRDDVLGVRQLPAGRRADHLGPG